MRMQRCECCSYRGGIHGRMAVRFSVACQDPILEVPTPGKTVPSDKTSHRSDPRSTHQSEQGSPSTSGTPRKAPSSHSPPNTQDTHNRDHVIQVPLALSATGSPSVPKIPQPGMKRSPPASPEKHRASKGLRALSFPWLSKTFGLLNLDEEHRLKAKKQALEESLADTATKPQRKAVVPSKEVVWALEEGASSLSMSGIIRPEGTVVPGVEPHTVMDSYILGLARFQLGCSARFNDLQHVHPREIHCTTETVELQAWQTKTVSAAKIRRHPVPLICPKYSFSGKDWWSGLVALIRKLTQEERFKDMDFLIPTVSKGFNGVICRPSTPDRGLRWLKEALFRQGINRELIDPLTWHSFRVFIPDCAFQLGVPRTQRQYLGNWLTESTADVYTREKRNVVVSIWQRVASKVDTLNMKPGRERREDLNHPDWDEPILDLEEEPREGRVPVDTPVRTPGSSSWSAISTDRDSPAPKVLFTEPAPGSLRVVSSRTRTTASGQYRIHLLNGEGTAVGCGWRPKSGSVEDLSPDDFRNEMGLYGKCTRCFKSHDLPLEYQQGPAQVNDAPADSDSSNESGSDTDDSVDTESDKEHIELPLSRVP